MNARSARQRKNALRIAAAVAAVALIAFGVVRSLERGQSETLPATIAFAGDPPAAAEVRTAEVALTDLPDRAARAMGSEPPPERSENSPSGDLVRDQSRPGRRERRAKKKELETLGYALPPAPAEIKASFIIRPLIDAHRIRLFDPGHPVQLIADYGGSRATGSGFLLEQPSVQLVDRPVQDAPVVVLTVDHLDALPTSVKIYPSSWGMDGLTFTATPTVTLVPMDGRLRLASRPADRPRPGEVRKSFSGRCALVTIRENGDVQVLDSLSFGEREARRAPMLRFTTESTWTVILGIPESPAMAGDLIDVSALLEGDDDPENVVQVPTTLRGIRPPRHRFEVLDPFQEPVAGCQLQARVDPSVISVFDARGLPVQVDGFVFVKSSARSPDVNAQVCRKGGVELQPIGLARVSALAESTASGEAILEGLHAGIHLVDVVSPFGDREPLDQNLVVSGGPQVARAPVVGLSVQCPVEWRQSEEGRKAWARATVELSGDHRALTFTGRDAESLQPRRYLIRPGQPMTVTCTASGQEPTTAPVAAQPSQAVAVAFPKAAPDSPSQVSASGRTGKK
ncbi:hypothetical protein [Planctomycetes bacterium Poly30]|uniref:hypothetical protein n=1 Tax=Saltatorellus ferox TaxID=2528018 RepID=UPI0011A2076A